MRDEPALQITLTIMSAVQSFASLETHDRKRLKDVFEVADKADERITLVGSIEDAIPRWSRATCATFLEFLVSLYDLDRVLDVSDQATVATMVSRSDRLDIDDDHRARLAVELEEILTSDRLNLVARAQDLTLEYERVLDEVRIITDIRPVFTPGDVENLDGAIISHSLRLRYKGRDGPDRYISLDRSRLLSLQRQVNRAVSKQTRLEGFLRGASLPYVEVDEPREDDQ